KNFQALPLFDPSGCIPTSVHDENNKAGENLLYAYPNPFQESTTIKFETKGDHTLVQIFNNQGVLMQTLYDGDLAPGKYDLPCDLGQAPAGIYYARIQNGKLQQVKAIHKVR
ncbi:MAG: T9SS type A sorting domain-containing protein, partial [Saprospiraceae bacterium]